MATDSLVARRAHATAQVADRSRVTPAPGGRDANDRLDRVLADCVRQCGASVHIDVSGGTLTVRIRTNGTLHEALAVDGPRAAALHACVRLRAGLTGGQTEGRLSGAGSDWLVSCLPIAGGARFLLKCTDAPAAVEPLAALGMAPALIRAIDGALVDQVGGVVVVAGPPGSGRSSTLRALLARLNIGTRRLFAIDPVAEPVAGQDDIARIRTDPDDPRGTAAALRAVLRQDPDVVMLDDLPDRESAQIAFEAARTRRLLLLGIEADDAVGAIARLRALRVERFLLASTLRVVVAQRLAKRLCPDCRRPVQATAAVSALLGFDPGAVIHASSGCDGCSGSGHAGHVAVFEAIACDTAISRLLNDGGDAAILARHAFVAAPNLGSAARALVREGRTSPEEALRISRSGGAVTC